MSNTMRSIEETMRVFHCGDFVTDPELLQARIALESLSKAAAYFGEAMRPVVHYANITAANMRSIEAARAEQSRMSGNQ